jgi:excinuclease ABC subunit B
MPFRPKTAPSKVPFELKSQFQPAGDQPQAIEKLVSNINSNHRFQTLLGVTGSGKTFTIANVIQQIQKPTLVIAPNKTLAAQLYAEFREFFPANRVSYFVSYYDYYQPEAYVPSTDTFIEKDAAINEEIDKMRHSATKALLESRDSIVVASVSCIYGLGAPEDYYNMSLFVAKGERISREEVIRSLVTMQYKRGAVDFVRASFRVRGDVIDIFPSDQDEMAIRLVFFGSEIEEIKQIDALSGHVLKDLETAAVYPVSHFVSSNESVLEAIKRIRSELKERVKELNAVGKTFEAQRLEQRTLYDLELLSEIGFCPGIENYSRHLAGRNSGEPSTTLLDYFPKDLLLVVDESHVTISQIGGMYRGDQARKQTLVDFGFRLPSAKDNRPLKIEEFWDRVGQAVFVSATPGDFEIDQSKGAVVEQVNRPTGLLDPEVTVKPAQNQVDDLIIEIRKTIELGDRVLVTTLTKRMSEDLADYLREIGIRCRYLHSDIVALERVEILKGLRRGEFDVLIGINLLREGLDLVEVGLVAILDADKEGFLRSTRSLIQTMGRAARNLRGRVIMYADKLTKSMEQAIAEANRRRAIQAKFNLDNDIVPQSAKSSSDFQLPIEVLPETEIQVDGASISVPSSLEQQSALVESLKKQMFEAAAKKDYERAAQLRDSIKKLEKLMLVL